MSVEHVVGAANEDRALSDAVYSESIERVLTRFREVALKAGIAHGVAASEIDEVLQDVRIRLWRAGSTGGAVKLETLTRSYIYRAAASAALDLLRRRRARREHLTDTVLPDKRSTGIGFAAPDQSVLGRETLDGVAAALAELQPNRRVAVRLHLMGYDREEIAELLHWSEAKTRAAGITVGLRSTSTHALVPPAVFVPGGATGVSFALTTQPVSQPTTANLSTMGLSLGAPGAATSSGPQIVAGGPTTGSVTAQLTIGPGPLLALFTLRPTTAQGETNIIGSLKLSPGAATPVIVRLETDRPDVLTMPATVTITQSSVAQPFTVRTAAVPGPVAAVVTAETQSPAEKKNVSVRVRP